FMTTKRLNQRQIWWAEELAQYNFEIVYTEGKKNLKADALTRRSGDQPREGDHRITQRYRPLLKPSNFEKPIETISNIQEAPIESQIKDTTEPRDIIAVTAHPAKTGTGTPASPTPSAA